MADATGPQASLPATPRACDVASLWEAFFERGSGGLGGWDFFQIRSTLFVFFFVCLV